MQESLCYGWHCPNEPSDNGNNLKFRSRIIKSWKFCKFFDEFLQSVAPMAYNWEVRAKQAGNLNRYVM